MEKLVSVLLVDDHRRWRETIRTLLLEHGGFRVVAEVADGPEALKEVGEFQPDLVLLDINLPTISGIEVARQIAKLAPHSKVIYVTENSSPPVREAAMATNPAGYVTKSRALDNLLPTINAALKSQTASSR